MVPRMGWKVFLTIGELVIVLFAIVPQAAARQYGPGDIRQLVNLWNANRTEFKGVVQGVDTFSGLGTLESISASSNPNAFDVVVSVGLTAQVSCSANAVEGEKGDTVTVSGRIDSVSTATPSPRGGAGGPGADSTRDSLRLQGCAVRKALSEKK
jgi:hypothetical protein